MKNKPFNFQKLLIFGGIPSAAIAFLTALAVISKSFTAYADAPKNIEKLTAVQQDTVKILAGQQADLAVQQKMLDYLLNKEIKKDNEPILSPDGKFRWNEEGQKWERVK